MNITEIRIKLVPGKRDKLRGFASITVDDCIVIRDIKIIDGGQGIFIAMPSRKLCDRCPSCAGKNHVRARYCNECGAHMNRTRAENDERGRPRLYADVAHPIHQRAREFVQGVILAEYQLELERSNKEGYVAKTFDDLDYDYLIENRIDDLY